MSDIWVIDDDVEMCGDVIEFWERLSNEFPLNFHQFPRAEEALEKLSSLTPGGKHYPLAIIVDGHLRLDEGELVNGAAVVKEILGARGKDAPILIAWSADPFANEDMMAAGATVSFGKTKPREVVRYIQKYCLEVDRRKVR